MAFIFHLFHKFWCDDDLGTKLDRYQSFGKMWVLYDGVCCIAVAPEIQVEPFSLSSEFTTH
eukprot:CAMPEP_0202470070 /NCGR_PEP_ID=MMETSP1360-20130828/80380_1 /ASSEMBLY_ACC=CAM_ASM_000848 /TAXON_ID=515479 /ORGANISM="Licmophora paradoxa, Strain CCMP2313" /LENGTH=60 /DNA_ID=CAMNT_0049095631 /DNA_START=8 /DNA_END=187 /DNA_ORIENTATION=+